MLFFWSFCLFESFCADIFIQQCHFLRQSGHSEKAVSLFQAMIDFTFYKPDSVRQLSTRQQVGLFATNFKKSTAISGVFYLTRPLKKSEQQSVLTFEDYFN